MTNFEFATMMISEAFNPYTYRETGSIQVSTRFEGSRVVDNIGNYVHQRKFSSHTLLSTFLYADQNQLTYNDEVFFGLHETKMNFTEFVYG